MTVLFAWLKGFSISGGLIIAIGPQNLFVIKQSLQRRHLFLTALLCSVIDSLLIILGVMGFGQFVSAYPLIIDFTKYVAAIFLFFYGVLALKSALKKKSLNTGLDEKKPVYPVTKTILSLLAFSLLNPHVYLDTILLLGGIATQQPEHEQLYFAFGAIGASFTWFFAITYGACLFAPYLQRENTWRIIDTLIAFTMWAIACSILIN